MSKKYENMNDYKEPEELDPKEKKKRRSIFYKMYSGEGKGVEKGEVAVIDKPSLANFFKLFWRKLNKIAGVNAFLVFGNFPFFFVFLALAYTTGSATAPARQIYSALEAVSRFDPSPIVMSYLGVYGGQNTVATMTTVTYVLFALAFLVIFTFGITNVGTTYILRNIVRGEAVFVWSDFWYAVKRNLRQAIIFGIVDVLMIAMFVFDIMTYRLNVDSNVGMFMFVMSAGMAIFYFFMRMYIYPMMVTFDMKFFKLIKNGMLLAILGIKRNIMALFGALAVLIIEIVLMAYLPPVAFTLPILITFGLIGFICIYASYPNIKRIMIDPYYKNGTDDNVETETAD